MSARCSAQDARPQRRPRTGQDRAEQDHDAGQTPQNIRQDKTELYKIMMQVRPHRTSDRTRQS